VTLSVFVRCDSLGCVHNKDGNCTRDSIRIGSLANCVYFERKGSSL
jgi:hypothetical protein